MSRRRPRRVLDHSLGEHPAVLAWRAVDPKGVVPERIEVDVPLDRSLVADLDLESFDLILIDDSKTSVQRAATIRAVVRKQPQHPWIVIHDFEVEDYRKAARDFKHCHRFRGYNPETGVVGNRHAEWNTIDQIIRSKAKVFEPDAVTQWVDSF